MSGSSQPSDRQREAVRQARQAIADARLRARSHTQGNLPQAHTTPEPARHNTPPDNPAEVSPAAERNRRQNEDIARDLMSAADLVRRAETLLNQVQHQLQLMQELHHSLQQQNSQQSAAKSDSTDDEP